MKNFWISWYHDAENMGGFTLAFPWWTSGYSHVGETICAAVKAKSVEAAWQLVENSYRERPKILVRRFCEIRESDWVPFNDRFPRADWMTWSKHERLKTVGAL